MADFYYRIGDESIGPLTGIELREAAFAGRVVPDTFVATSEYGPWVPASRIKNLFDANGITLPHPPDAQRLIEKARAPAVEAVPQPPTPREARDTEPLLAGSELAPPMLPSARTDSCPPPVHAEFRPASSPASSPAPTSMSEFASKPSEIGNTEPNCPYCNHQLDKMPGRNKKCPVCGRQMLVRTRPSDRKQILIREDQSMQIEEQWAIVNGTHDQFLAVRKAYEAERNRLRDRCGREPLETEIQWAQLSNDLLQHANQFQWRLYRNARLLMGDILRKDGRYSDALDTYLEVCYIDLNGPNNCGTRDPLLLHEFPPFTPKNAILAPGVLVHIENILESEGFTKDNTRARFLEIAARVQRSLNLPVAPDMAWSKLSKEFS